MSSILAKDRKPLGDRLQAAVLIEEVTKELSRIVYNDKKVPKRRQQIGIKILENVIEAYEYTRAANLLGFNTKAERSHRKTYQFNAEKAMNSVVSDLKLLPMIAPTVKNNWTWYVKIVEKATEAALCVSAWRKSDEKRIDTIEKESNM